MKILWIITFFSNRICYEKKNGLKKQTNLNYFIAKIFS